jgi:uncharacterized protein DUF6851/vanadium-dependent haloperoxidase-like protein
MPRRTDHPLVGAAKPIALLLGMTCLVFPTTDPIARAGIRQNVALAWSNAAVLGIRDAKLGAPAVSRALAIVHTCMYDAWAAYDERAVSTQLGGALRRPVGESTLANKERAISYAGFRALSDVVPVDTESVYKPLMKQLGYDPNDRSTDIETPTGIGNVACGAVLEFRHHDKSNQLGEMAAGSGEAGPSEAGSKQGGGLRAKATGPYSDWTGYVPVNSPGTVPARTFFVKPLNPEHWQPLTYVDASGSLVLQGFARAQWCFVTPFALVKGDEFRPALEPGPAKYGSPEYLQQAEELLILSANLTDQQKMMVEYWADGPGTEQPLGHWLRFAAFISARDHHTLDDDVKMHFILSSAMLDVGIAAWDAKRAYDSVRPVTAISLLFQGKKIRAWGGPGKGAVEMDGSQWIPYQALTSPTPPFPEYVSADSAYSTAAAHLLELWTGSDRFGYSVTLPPGSSKIEPGITPARAVTLRWETFTAAAAEDGMSRRYGGIHFASADLAGRKLGRLVADRAWSKARGYFDGTASSLVREKPAIN